MEACCLSLDKPLPAGDAELTIENVPEILGEMLVFGKQTDREARVELLLTKSDDYWLKTTAAAEVLGHIGPRPAVDLKTLFAQAGLI